MALIPIQNFRAGSYEYLVLDNGLAITTAVTVAAGVPVPNNPGAAAQGQNVYGNGTIPDSVNRSTTILNSRLTTRLLYLNPA